MKSNLKQKAKELDNTLSKLPSAKTVESIVEIVNRAVDINDDLQDAIEEEMLDSEDKDKIIEELKGEISSLEAEHKNTLQQQAEEWENKLIRVKAALKEKEELITTLERAENYVLSDEVADLNLHEILGLLKEVSYTTKEINSKVEGTEKTVRNMNLNSNATQKTLSKLSGNVSNLVELLKVYVKNVAKVEERVEDSFRASKDAVDKVEEVESVVKDNQEEVKTAIETIENMEESVNEAKDVANECLTEVKEVRGIFAKLKGLFR